MRGIGVEKPETEVAADRKPVCRRQRGASRGLLAEFICCEHPVYVVYRNALTIIDECGRMTAVPPRAILRDGPGPRSCFPRFG